MIWIVAFLILGYVAFRFLFDLNKDKDDLNGISLSEKFQVVVEQINQYAFDGFGKVTPINKRSFNLYQDGKNQIVKFQYGTGHLTITWKYKYFQKEVVHEKTFNYVRNLSIFEQQKIAETMISEMAQVIQRHQSNVIGI